MSLFEKINKKKWTSSICLATLSVVVRSV